MLITGAGGEIGHGLIERLGGQSTRAVVTLDVARLEQRYDESEATGLVDPEDEDEEDDDDWLDEDDLPTGDSLAEDFERYLRDYGEE